MQGAERADKDEAPGQTPWIQGAAMATMWWPVLAFVSWSIYARVQAKYFDGLLLASGINGAPSFADTLYLYRQDLLIFGVIVPLVTAFLFARLSFARAATICAVAILAVQALLYANLQSWGQVGSFLNWQSLQNAISFGLSKPEFVGEYIALDGIAKLAVLLAFSALVMIVGRLLWRRAWVMRVWGAAGAVSLVLFTGLALAGYSSSMRSAPISDSFFVNALAALGQNPSSGVTPMAEGQLDARYTQLAGITPQSYQGPNSGVHQGSNLLIFVMETASIEFLDTRGALPDHPALAQLSEGLFVANNHFSTFPASAEGLLSLFTGTYPPRAIYGTCLIDMPRLGNSLPGPIKQLRAAGYQTGVYAPYSSQVPADKTVFEATGFDTVFYGNSVGGDDGADGRALARMKQDIEAWGRSGQSFAAALMPQIGHGPWPEELGPTIQARGAHVARVQLDWLGEIIETLRASGQLDNTVIILTGDHGVRTTIEDARVKAGMIDWYSFHVPMLLYAPRADYSDLSGELPSSHVDLSAEIAELFGLAHLPSYQGLAFHHPGRAGRRSFLMAGWYFGANGYRERGEAAMHSDLLDAVYARPDERVEFGIEQLIIDEHRRSAIRGRVMDMAALQEAWIAQRLCRDDAAGPIPEDAVAEGAVAGGAGDDQPLPKTAMR